MGTRAGSYVVGCIQLEAVRQCDIGSPNALIDVLEGNGLIIAPPPPPQPRVLGASGQHCRTQRPWVIMCVWRRGTGWQVATGPRGWLDVYDVC